MDLAMRIDTLIRKKHIAENVSRALVHRSIIMALRILSTREFLCGNLHRKNSQSQSSFAKM